MKTFVLFLSLIASMSALAECQREAQFIGEVRQLSHSMEMTTFKIRLTRWFQPSMVCPMDESEAEAAEIMLVGWHDLEEGQEISGILVYKPETGTYVIE